MRLSLSSPLRIYCSSGCIYWPPCLFKYALSWPMSQKNTRSSLVYITSFSLMLLPQYAHEHTW